MLHTCLLGVVRPQQHPYVPSASSSSLNCLVEKFMNITGQEDNICSSKVLMFFWAWIGLSQKSRRPLLGSWHGPTSTERLASPRTSSLLNIILFCTEQLCHFWIHFFIALLHKGFQSHPLAVFTSDVDERHFFMQRHFEFSHVQWSHCKKTYSDLAAGMVVLTHSGQVLQSRSQTSTSIFCTLAIIN